MTGLIDRLEKAEKPSRDLDVEICELLTDYSRTEYSRWCGIQPRGASATVRQFLQDRLSTRYTASIDHALALFSPEDRLEALSSAVQRVGIAGYKDDDVAGYVARDLCAIFLEERPTPSRKETR